MTDSRDSILATVARGVRVGPLPPSASLERFERRSRESYRTIEATTGRSRSLSCGHGPRGGAPPSESL